MNIFYLDECPLKAAKYHCDNHVSKMVLETAQLLSSLWYKYPTEIYGLNNTIDEGKIYSPTHSNHPCCTWLTQSNQNYAYLINLGLSLSREFKFRYYKEHESSKIIKYLASKPVPKKIPIMDTTTHPALAMPDMYKVPNDPVQSYRNYYKYGKSSLLKYTNRPWPEWLLLNEGS